MSSVKDNVLRVKEDIASVCRKLGRDPDSVTLICVTKFAPEEKITEAIKAGVAHIAENKVQEGLKKYPPLSALGLPLTRHMIGHLQTNKVKDVLKVFDMIQSVDSLKLALEVEKQAAKVNRVVDILIQISTSGEEQKFGVDENETLSLLDEAAKLKNVRVKGLMTMAPLTEDKAVIKDCFRKLREWRDKIDARFKGSPAIEMKYLSMGMSQDFPLALEEGSNMVRIGSAIFKE